MSRLRDRDLQALVEACAESGYTFPATVTEVRREAGGVDLLTAVRFTEYGLTLASRANHLQAKDLLERHYAFQREIRRVL